MTKQNSKEKYIYIFTVKNSMGHKGLLYKDSDLGLQIGMILEGMKIIDILLIKEKKKHRR